MGRHDKPPPPSVGSNTAFQPSVVTVAPNSLVLRKIALNGKCDLEISAQGHCRSTKMSSLKCRCWTSYWSSIETIALNCSLFQKTAF